MVELGVASWAGFDVDPGVAPGVLSGIAGALGVVALGVGATDVSGAVLADPPLMPDDDMPPPVEPAWAMIWAR